MFRAHISGMQGKRAAAAEVDVHVAAPSLTTIMNTDGEARQQMHMVHLLVLAMNQARLREVWTRVQAHVLNTCTGMPVRFHNAVGQDVYSRQ